ADRAAAEVAERRAEGEAEGVGAGAPRVLLRDAGAGRRGAGPPTGCRRQGGDPAAGAERGPDRGGRGDGGDQAAGVEAAGVEAPGDSACGAAAGRAAGWEKPKEAAQALGRPSRP